MDRQLITPIIIILAGVLLVGTTDASAVETTRIFDPSVTFVVTDARGRALAGAEVEIFVTHITIPNYEHTGYHHRFFRMQTTTDRTGRAAFADRLVDSMDNGRPFFVSDARLSVGYRVAVAGYRSRKGRITIDAQNPQPVLAITLNAVRGETPELRYDESFTGTGYPYDFYSFMNGGKIPVMGGNAFRSQPGGAHFGLAAVILQPGETLEVDFSLLEDKDWLQIQLHPIARDGSHQITWDGGSVILSLRGGSLVGDREQGFWIPNRTGSGWTAEGSNYPAFSLGDRHRASIRAMNDGTLVARVDGQDYSRLAGIDYGYPGRGWDISFKMITPQRYDGMNEVAISRVAINTVAVMPEAVIVELPDVLDHDDECEDENADDTRPGWGHGDDNHEHTGPPDQQEQDREATNGDTRPGHGYGDNNHEHTGPPGQQTRTLRNSEDGEVVVTEDRANLRTGPGTNNPIVERGVCGMRYPLIASEGEWFKVRLPDGRIAWIAASVSEYEAALVSSTSPASLAENAPSDIPPAGTVWTNSLGMKFVYCPSGEFMMGSPDGEGCGNEHPQHRVTITKGFYLGMYEVTVGEYKRFVEAVEYEANRIDARRTPGFRQSDNYPVTFVIWDDAQKFCAWLNQTTGETYRLPTEAEWEYACRAGTTTAYQWGDNPDAGYGWLNAADRQYWSSQGAGCYFNFNDGYRNTAPVGSFRANNWGLYDMHGNVWEWCADWFGRDYYQQSSPDNSQGPSSGTSRVYRGGGWNFNPDSVRSAYRNYDSPWFWNDCIGFRILRDVP